jgi:hypothetical protein
VKIRKAGEQHEARREALDFRAKRRFERLAAREGAMLDHARSYATGRGELEALGIRAVADHAAHRQTGLEQRLQVAAAPGNQRDDQVSRRPIIASGRTQRSKSCALT